MGNAADLFYAADSDKETLHQRICPSDDQRQEQTERWNELADYLRDWLKEKTGFNVSTWIQGSYKFGTQIRPARKGEEFDIDLGVYLEWQGRPSEKMSASGLKRHVREAVNSFATEAEGVREVVMPPKERCERVRYDGDFHIDLPGYHLDPDEDARSLATETKGWEFSDPKALVLWFREKADDPDDRTQLRRAVRYLKMWAALKFKSDCRPSSILLTVLATDAYCILSEVPPDDDDMLEGIIKEIISRLENDHEVPNPVDTDEDLNRLGLVETNNFIDRLKGLHQIAKRAIAAGTKLEASVIWSEAFEHFFPVPEQNEVLEHAAANRSYPLVPIRTLDIEVIATPSNGIGRTYRGKNAIGPIPKNYDIDFKVLSNLSMMADVQWTVRNRGAEAGEVNDLGHRAATGRSAAEHSAYNGTHYMDCFAKENGRLVGYRRVPVQIHDGVSRNPARRNYVRFRGRSR